MELLFVSRSATLYSTLIKISKKCEVFHVSKVKNRSMSLTSIGNNSTFTYCGSLRILLEQSDKVPYEPPKEIYFKHEGPNIAPPVPSMCGRDPVKRIPKVKRK